MSASSTSEPPAGPPGAPPGGGGPGDGGDGEVPVGGGIEPIEIQEEMERSFLDYAMSVIVSRALPDARDGLKPVHRRILYSMHEQGFRPDRPWVKSARVVGDVIALYHPHGDSAVYEALVRMAQPFSLRHPLIDGHGNFGSPDDPPAAYRYTECRLDVLAMELLAGLDEETVDFADNFSGDRQEPTVLPARFPNLLVNGSEGIAVGMATRIPPHNLGEVSDAVTHLLDHPDATVDDLMRFVRGPDFPTGGQILGRSGIGDAYRTGRGSVRMRARVEFEEARGRTLLVVTELPYQGSVLSIAERIAELVDKRTIDGIRNVNDESSQGRTRLVVELKRDANPSVILNQLFQLTPLQTSFPVNMVALVDGIPRTLNLLGVLQAYVDHQIEVVTRRSEFRLAKAKARAHILEGLLRALDIIDEIIALIRASADRGAARDGLMAEPFSFSEVQANHILDMTLARLTRLARSEIEDELARLTQTIAELEAILADDAKLRGVIKAELGEIRNRFATPRRAEIVPDPGDPDIEDLIEDEELVVSITRAGYVKAVAATAFRAQQRGGKGQRGTSLKESDVLTHGLHTSAHAHLLLFTNLGRVHRLRVHEIPQKERQARGTPLPNLLPQLASGERVQAVIDTRFTDDQDRYLFFCTRLGVVKRTRLADYDSRSGIIALNLRDGDELVAVLEIAESDDIILVSRRGQAVRFAATDVRSMGRTAAGVRGMKLRPGDEVVGGGIARDDAALLLVTASGYAKRTALGRFATRNRGIQGVLAIKVTPERGDVIGAHIAGPDEHVLVLSDGGQVINVAVADISEQGPYATGVRLMQVREGETVAAVAPIVGDDEATLAGAVPGEVESPGTPD